MKITLILCDKCKERPAGQIYNLMTGRTICLDCYFDEAAATIRATTHEPDCAPAIMTTEEDE